MKKLIMVLALAGLVVSGTFPVTVYADDVPKTEKKKKSNKKKNNKKKTEQAPSKHDDAPAGDKR